MWLHIIAGQLLFAATTHACPYFQTDDFTNNVAPSLSDSRASQECLNYMADKVSSSVVLTGNAVSAQALNAIGPSQTHWKNGLVWCCADVCSGLMEARRVITYIFAEAAVVPGTNGDTAEKVFLTCHCAFDGGYTALYNAHRRLDQCVADYGQHCANGGGFSFMQCNIQPTYLYPEVRSNNYYRLDADYFGRLFLDKAASPECIAEMEEALPTTAVVGGLALAHPEEAAMRKISAPDFVATKWKNAAGWCCVQMCKRGQMPDAKIRNVQANIVGADSVLNSHLQCTCYYTGLPTMYVARNDYAKCLTDYNYFCHHGTGEDTGCKSGVQPLTGTCDSALLKPTNNYMETGNMVNNYQYGETVKTGVSYHDQTEVTCIKNDPPFTLRCGFELFWEDRVNGVYYPTQKGIDEGLSPNEPPLCGEL